MFHPVKDKFQQRLNILNREKAESYRVKDALMTYFKIQGYPEPNIFYRKDEATILIETPFKALANDLTLRLGDIHELLKKENLTVRKIIIR